MKKSELCLIRQGPRSLRIAMAFKKWLCKWLGHKLGDQVVDTERRKCYNPCLRCGHETQFDFQASLDPRWIGFASSANGNRCPLCFGWKPRASQFCTGTFCELNPNGPIRLS